MESDWGINPHWPLASTWHAQESSPTHMCTDTQRKWKEDWYLWGKESPASRQLWTWAVPPRIFTLPVFLAGCELACFYNHMNQFFKIDSFSHSTPTLKPSLCTESMCCWICFSVGSGLMSKPRIISSSVWFLVMVVIESRALYMTSKYSTIELHPQLLSLSLHSTIVLSFSTIFFRLSSTEHLLPGISFDYLS